jgi:hypothetical protein
VLFIVALSTHVTARNHLLSVRKILSVDVVILSRRGHPESPRGSAAPATDEKRRGMDGCRDVVPLEVAELPWRW